MNNAVRTTPIPGTTQKASYTGTAAATSAAVKPGGTGSVLVRLWATTDCFVAFGAAPTATTSDMPLTAKTETFVAVEAGWKVSAVQQSAGGDLYVTTCRSVAVD
jgi:hypothetical protein